MYSKSKERFYFQSLIRLMGRTIGQLAIQASLLSLSTIV